MLSFVCPVIKHIDVKYSKNKKVPHVPLGERINDVKLEFKRTVKTLVSVTFVSVTGSDACMRASA